MPCACEMAYTNTHDLFGTEFWGTTPLPLPAGVTGTWTVVSTPPLANVTIFSIAITTPPQNPPVDRVPVGQYKFRWTYTANGETNTLDVCYFTSESIRSRYLATSSSPADINFMNFTPTVDGIFHGGNTLKFETRKCPGAPPVNYGQVGGVINHTATTYKLQNIMNASLNASLLEACPNAEGAKFLSILLSNSQGGTQLVLFNTVCYRSAPDNGAALATSMNASLAGFNTLVTYNGFGNFTFTSDIKHVPVGNWFGVKKATSVLTRSDGVTTTVVNTINPGGTIDFNMVDTGICVANPTTLTYSYSAPSGNINGVVNFTTTDLNIVNCTAPCKVDMGTPSGTVDAFCTGCAPCPTCT
jgi:hypothetical protein